MQILLKDLLKEVGTTTTTDNPLQVQIYVDMDGVLVDMEKGFKAISGGYSIDRMKEKFGGDKKAGQREFWKIINKKPDFWISLPAKPDAMVLWKFISNNFKNPVPVILSAGQGSTVQQQKTEWIHKHISPDVKVLIAPSGIKKPEYVINPPQESGKYITHVLIDDTLKNINVWDNQAAHRVAIHHTSAAETIKALQIFIK